MAGPRLNFIDRSRITSTPRIDGVFLLVLFARGRGRIARSYYPGIMRPGFASPRTPRAVTRTLTNAPPGPVVRFPAPSRPYPLPQPFPGLLGLIVRLCLGAVLGTGLLSLVVGVVPPYSLPLSRGRIPSYTTPDFFFNRGKPQTGVGGRVYEGITPTTPRNESITRPLSRG